MAEEENIVPQIDHLKFARAAGAVKRALLEMFGGLRGMEGRDGAAFLATDLDGTLVHFEMVGKVARGSGFKYDRVAREKANRTALLNTFAGLMSRSRDSADPAVERYQGAVAGEKFVWSISGYTGAVDEFGSIALSYVLDDNNFDTACELAKGNDHDARIQDLLNLAQKYFDED